MFEAVIRDLGKPSYKGDGAPQLEINLPVGRAEGLPFRAGERVLIRLKIDGREYDAGLRATPDHTNVWVCPDIYDADGTRLTLGRVLTDAGFAANDAVRLALSGLVVEVLTSGDQG